MLRIFVLSLIIAQSRGDDTSHQSQDQSLVTSLAALTKSCDQSQNYVSILNAVHSSLDLQVIIRIVFFLILWLWNLRKESQTWRIKCLIWSTHCLASVESLDEIWAEQLLVQKIFSSAQWGARLKYYLSDDDEIFPGQVLRCRGCVVTYAKTHVNNGQALNHTTGVFTAPVAGSYYFQVNLENNKF